MADHDDIKNRFTQRVRAAQDANRTAGIEEAEKLERAFAPIAATAAALREAVVSLGDSGQRLDYDPINQEGDGHHMVRVRLTRPGANAAISVLYGASMGTGMNFWVKGLSHNAEAQLVEAGGFKGNTRFGDNGIRIEEGSIALVTAAIETSVADFFSLA